MSTPDTHHSDDHRPEPSGTANATPDAIGQLIHLWTASKHGIRALPTLAALEAKRAGLSAGIIGVCAVVAALALLVSWFLLSMALAATLYSMGLSMAVALSAAAAVNLLLVAISGYVAYRHIGYLQFPATREQIKNLRGAMSGDSEFST